MTGLKKILGYNAERRRRKGKPRNNIGLRRSMISKSSQRTEDCGGSKFL